MLLTVVPTISANVTVIAFYTLLATHVALSSADEPAGGSVIASILRRLGTVFGADYRVAINSMIFLYLNIALGM